jgi:hypothetical protein
MPTTLRAIYGLRPVRRHFSAAMEWARVRRHFSAAMGSIAAAVARARVRRHFSAAIGPHSAGASTRVKVCVISAVLPSIALTLQ